ncbi:sciellin isoform X2 [Entelurus aequoreus]|uniref:sciellin isoform X2 n=1 Tax=Entelurus aequoreus TaxID=161455 RepID=UPI002B1E220A|nr:sciellin isoform X2 [Entelurus aequoreus]
MTFNQTRTVRTSSTLLKDSSWIRRDEDEFEPVDRDPNFGSSVLSPYTSIDSINRFSSSQDELNGSPYSVSKSYSSSSYSNTDPSSSTTTTTVSRDGKTTETTFTTSLRKTPSETFSERVQSSSKGLLYSNLSPTRTTSVTETYSSQKDTEDKLYDTLLPSALRDDISDSRTYIDDNPTTRITSYTVSSNSLPSQDYSKNYYYSSTKPSYEYSGIGSPSEYTSTMYRSSSTNDILSAPISNSSIRTVYTSPDRSVFERELCTYCHKPFNGDAKMILDDMNINCHAFCFKCEVCNGTLGHMKAGDYMWVYNRMVHCENCFDNTREKWRR